MKGTGGEEAVHPYRLTFFIIYRRRPKQYIPRLIFFQDTVFVSSSNWKVISLTRTHILHFFVPFSVLLVTPPQESNQTCNSKLRQKC